MAHLIAYSIFLWISSTLIASDAAKDGPNRSQSDQVMIHTANTLDFPTYQCRRRSTFPIAKSDLIVAQLSEKSLFFRQGSVTSTTQNLTRVASFFISPSSPKPTPETLHLSLQDSHSSSFVNGLGLFSYTPALPDRHLASPASPSKSASFSPTNYPFKSASFSPTNYPSKSARFPPRDHSCVHSTSSGSPQWEGDFGDSMGRRFLLSVKASRSAPNDPKSVAGSPFFVGEDPLTSALNESHMVAQRDITMSEASFAHAVKNILMACRKIFDRCPQQCFMDQKTMRCDSFFIIADIMFSFLEQIFSQPSLVDVHAVVTLTILNDSLLNIHTYMEPLFLKKNCTASTARVSRDNHSSWAVLENAGYLLTNLNFLQPNTDSTQPLCDIAHFVLCMSDKLDKQAKKTCAQDLYSVMDILRNNTEEVFNTIRLLWKACKKNAQDLPSAPDQIAVLSDKIGPIPTKARNILEILAAFAQTFKSKTFE
ncbi:MAG: hypothetical protein OXC30_03575 [Alphaproteobacteria bacterium]|nr:hypothetical protein [Alphaproteobacteria bacterium]